MSIKITSKELRENYIIVNLARYNNIWDAVDRWGGRTRFYNGGVYGWNYDAIPYKHVAFVRGYRSTPKSIDAVDILKKYENKFKNAHKHEREIRDRAYGVNYETAKKIYRKANTYIEKRQTELLQQLFIDIVTDQTKKYI